MNGRNPYRKPFSLFKDTNRKYWQFWYWDSDRGRQQSTGKVKRWQAEEDAKKFTGSGASRVLLIKEYLSGFFDAGSAWIERRQNAGTLPSPDVVRDMVGKVKNHILPGIGEFNLCEIV